jgi:hypothetical protein
VVPSYEKNVFFSCVQKHMREATAASIVGFGAGRAGQGVNQPYDRPLIALWQQSYPLKSLP